MNQDIRVAEIVSRWQTAVEAGLSPTPEELCAQWPELVPEVRRRIKDHPSNRRLLTHNGSSEVTYPEADPGQPVTGAVSALAEFHDLVLHASGGLGSVYRARDARLNRDVAVKFIHERLSGDDKSRERFLLESEVTGRLQHPGVVPVHAIGETSSGRLYYVMQLVEGETLEAAANSSRRKKNAGEGTTDDAYGQRMLLAHFVSVCKTIAFAHNRGIVHRDLKPANVMLGRFGETLVVDWGLACRVERADLFKQSGEETLTLRAFNPAEHDRKLVAGTPNYMSPEQTRGQMPTPAMDIYSLGATLFKILTGRPPYEGRSISEIRELHRRESVPSPRDFDRRISPALDAICRKAMAAHPHDRYATALELAQDVERYLADERVTAHRESMSRTLARWSRRHRTTTQAVLLGLLAVLLVTLISTAWLGRALRLQSRISGEAERSRALAEIAERRNRVLTARWLAQTIEQDIERTAARLQRWAASGRLTTLLAARADGVASPELQTWLDEVAAAESVLDGGRWYLEDPAGRILAEHGGASNSAAAHSTYAAEGLHLSRPFFDAATDRWSISISVAIENLGDLEQPSPAGRLGCVVPLVQLPTLCPALDRTENVLLIEVGSEDDQGSSMILYHRQLSLLPAERWPLRIDDAFLAFCHQRWSRPASQATTDVGSVYHRFTDPLDPGRQDTTACVEPVVFQDRDGRPLNVGWMVVVFQ